MPFSSAAFLFAFLPLSLLLLRLTACSRSGPQARNAALIGLSLVFYAASGLRFLPLLLGSALLNWLLGLAAARGERAGKRAAALAVACNLALLGCFKYLNFLTANLAWLGVPPTSLALPLGVSFFTFQGIGYVLEVRRDPALASRSFWPVLLYLCCFPRMLAGPLVRYAELEPQIAALHMAPEDVTEGLLRFVRGLAKKLLLADVLGLAVDAVYALPSGAADVRLAWLAAIGYTLQIYYDFSGLSDMAIGLSRICGFRLPENFRHPYCAGSMREFWRRWHISLSSWFRDYVYIPLGGSRRGIWRARGNRLLVFLLTGAWHGANWTFLLWGLWHGLCLLAEDLLPKPKRLPGRIWGRLCTLLAVTLGFMLFRADSLGQAWALLTALCGGTAATAASSALLASLTGARLWTTLGLAALCSLPLGERLRARTPAWLRQAAALALYALCILSLSANAFRPFIYAQF